MPHDQKQHLDMRKIIDSAPNGIIVVNQQGLLTLVNREAERMFMMKEQDLVGQPIENLMPERYRTEHEGHRHTYSNDPTSRKMGLGRELFGLRSNGEEFPIEIGLNPMMTSQGTFVIASIVDITARKKQESDLKRKNEELETLLYITSHDLREPLRTIQSFSDILHETKLASLDEEAQFFLQRISISAKKLDSLMKDLVLLTKVQQVTFDELPISLTEIAQQALSNLETLIAHSQAQIKVSYNMPATRLSRVWVTQAVHNLITNAIKYSKPDQPARIEIDSVPTNKLKPSEIGIAVKDQGTGVPTNLKDKIFQLFQRGDNKSVEGTGAGLAIVRRIAQQHGGRVWVEDNPGGGSIFYLTLEKK